MIFAYPLIASSLTLVFMGHVVVASFEPDKNSFVAQHEQLSHVLDRQSTDTDALQMKKENVPIPPPPPKMVTNCCRLGSI